MNKKNISKEQKEMLVDFLSKRPEMYAGKFTPTFTRARCQSLWSELATILNSMPEGANKNWEAWRKTWIDLKKNSKAKLATIRRHSQGTGGGPPLPEVYTENKTFEDKIFSMLAPVAVNGNEEVPEPTLQNEESMGNGDYSETMILELPTADEEEVEPQPSTNKHTYTLLQSTPTIKKPTLTATKLQRLTKTARLTESIKNHSRLLSTSQQGVDDTREYRTAKLKLLEDHYKNKENLQREQNELLQKICIHLGDLVFQSAEET